MQGDTQCSPRVPSESASDPQTQPTATVRNTHGFQLQESVYENANMDLTASEVNKIIVISKSNKNQRKKKIDCGKEVFRKVIQVLTKGEKDPRENVKVVQKWVLRERWKTDQKEALLS